MPAYAANRRIGVNGDAEELLLTIVVTDAQLIRAVIELVSSAL